LSQAKFKPSTRQSIYIYNGPGASYTALCHTKHTLTKFVHPKYTIDFLEPEGVRQGNWLEDTCLFIMPGGADIFYARTLKGKGNQQIQHYVQEGGRYLGFCAGAYYGSRKIAFAKGTTKEITSDRELGFYPDIAEGPTLKPWDHKTNSGAEAAVVMWNGPTTLFPNNHFLTVYYNGGGHFVNAHNYPQVSILASYTTTPEPKAAIIDITYGEGRVILSGIHCEFSPELFDMTDPFLAPLKEKLLLTDPDRCMLMINLLRELGIETI